MNLMPRSPRLAKHLMLMCAPCFVSGYSVKSEPSMSYQGYVAPVEMSVFSYGTYNDPILAASAGSEQSKPKSSKNSSKPKSSKRAKSSKNQVKRQMTAQPTDAPTSSPTPFPTLAPTTNETCPDDDNYYRTCYNGTSFTSTLPYLIGDEEEYDNGLMFLSSVFNAHANNITCNHLYQLEEITLSYLLDNAGGPDSFRPLCVYASSDYSSLTVHDNTRSILGAAFPVMVVFAVNKGWKDREEDEYSEPVFNRRLNHHNGIGDSCDSINNHNSNAKMCGGNRRRLASLTEDTSLLVEEILAPIKDTAPLSHIKSSQPADQQITLNGELEGVNFNDEFASYTGLAVIMTGALLNETDYFNATRVAWCGALYYGATVWEDYPVLCELFDVLACDINSFIDFDALAGNGKEYCCGTDSTTTKCKDEENLISFGNIEFTLN